ncbi:family 20 glycosylhydrolase [Phenylobacterium sp. J367]|uniref:family 20 glycosylhydrolase n=1 Tax=Phenylobacterium sp. J367 TaxID=2898435 RepID=UPI002151D4F1|nr:family 20 glycosylhydrolase [Phenylobacterium sp. J367]MCR5879377.1 family 20 glycosylhydrolase [Phenylobacterium sp. J367]
MRASIGPWIAAALAAAGILFGSAVQAAPDITPKPVSMAEAAGALRISDGATLKIDNPADRKTAAFLADLTARAGGPKLKLSQAPRLAVITFARGDVADPEGYRLEVSSQGVLVTARTEAGMFYGAMTLWQLLTAEPGKTVTLQGMRIDDAPRFKWRGLMLDSARHYQSPAFIRSLIDVMAAHKLNTLHWHLTDDQAWRLEIRKYPKLTEVGGWRVPAGEAPARDIDPATGKPRLYGGVYTQAEVKALVAYAAERQITIVPEIEMPGHASAASVAYPFLAAAPGSRTAVPSDWGVYPDIFNTDERTIGFLQDVLDEVVELFPSTYIHVGGDEAVKDQWKASPTIQAQMKALGLKDEHALQSWFVQRMEKHLSAKGRRLIGWDEILEGGLAPGATVMSWRGIGGALAAAKAGHDTVLSPAPILYFDNRQTRRSDEPPGRHFVVRLEDVYAFDPMPTQLSEAERRHVLGLQGNLWVEHIRTEARAAHMLFPRGLAVAERAWSPVGTRDVADFMRRAEPATARIRRLGFAAAETPFKGPETIADPLYRDSRQLKLCTTNIAIALEDDAPVRGERATFMTDIMNPCWIWEGADLTGVGAVRVDVGQLPFNYQIGKDIEKVVAGNSRTPEGELEVRVGGCKAEPIVVPLKPAAGNPAVTTLEAKLPPTTGSQDLCFTFARPKVDPMWALSGVWLEPRK